MGSCQSNDHEKKKYSAEFANKNKGINSNTKKLFLSNYLVSPATNRLEPINNVFRSPEPTAINKEVKRTKNRSKTSNKKLRIEDENQIILSLKSIIKKLKINPNKRYEIIKTLLVQNESKSFLIRHNNAQLLRKMKEIPLNSYTVTEHTREKDMLIEINHQNVIKFYDVFETSKYLYLIYEFSEYGTLRNMVKGEILDEMHATFILFQVLNALRVCHDNSIVHRQINLDTILVVDKNSMGHFIIKISEFNESAYLTMGRNLKTIKGKGSFVAPEVLNQNYDEKCDIWSCGVLFYILLCGKLPFELKNQELKRTGTLLSDLEFKGRVWENKSNESKNLVKQLLQKDYNKRVSAEEALKNPLFDRFRNNYIDIQKKSDIIENLIKFKNNSKIFSLCLFYILHNIQENQEIENLRKIFNNWDTSRTGKLSQKDFFEGFSKILGECKKEFQGLSHSFFDKISDGKNYINLNDFIRAGVNKIKILTDENIKIVFKFFDYDNSGKIKMSHLEFNFGRMFEVTSRKLLSSIFDSLDYDGDGEVSFEDFKKSLIGFAEY